MTKIPLNKPHITGKELEYIKNAINQQELSGYNPYTRKANEKIEKAFNARKALLTTSCTHALELSMLLIELNPGDEVILPSYTFSSSANSILLRGGEPVFADIKRNTLNIDPNDIRNKINENTKAIMPVHYAGVGCEMDKLKQIANDNNLYLIEDAAQAVNSKYKDEHLGSIGDIGCYSFHETKNYTMGEGGAILINSENEKLIERAGIIRDCGTNRKKFIEGQINEYKWVDIGSSYIPSNILSAFLLAQLENLEENKKEREKIHKKYMSKLKPLEEDGLIELPNIPKDRESNYHIFYILLNSEEKRNKLMSDLNDSGIGAAFHYIPLHSSPMGSELGYKPEDLPVTEEISKRILRLPIYPSLKDDEITFIVESIFDFFKEES